MASNRKSRRPNPPKRPYHQDKESGALFQVLDVHSLEAPYANKPPRKRKRESSECEHTNELKSMWTYLEGLAAQFGVLEEVTRVRGHQDSVTYKTALAGAAVISHNVPVFKEEEKANLNSQSPPSFPQSSRVYRCPAFNCTQNFERVDLFHQHIRDSYTNGHKILKNIIDQTCCLPCDESFARSEDLVNHERSKHGEQYGSRVFKFTGNQGQDDQDQGRDDRDQGQDDQGQGNNMKRVDNSPISSPNPEPPRDVALKDISEATEVPEPIEQSNADPFSHSTFQPPPEEGPCGISRDGSPSSNAQVWGSNSQFAEPSTADPFSHSAFHIFQPPPYPYVLQHNSLPNSNAQASRVGVELHGPSNADAFAHSSQLLFEQHAGGQSSASNAQLDIFAHSLNLFPEPLDEELFVWQDNALFSTSPLPNIRYLRSLGGRS